MALATSSNFYQNAIVGQPQVGADINVLDRHTSPRFSIGFGFTRGDGNKFRYVHYGAAVLAGRLVGCSNTNNNVFSVNGNIVAPATAQAMANETIKPGDVDSRYVEIILASVVNNQFAGGYLVTTKDTGVGYTYRIRGNTATGTPTTGNFSCELYEPIKVALNNTTDYAITPSVYADLDEVGVVGTSYNIAGVSMAAASADNWGWVCTHGIVGCLSSSAGIVGQEAVVGNGTTAGAVRVRPILTANDLGTAANTTVQALGSPFVGYYVVPAGAAAQQAIINVQLE